MTALLASKGNLKNYIYILLWSRQVRQEYRGPEADSDRVTEDQGNNADSYAKRTTIALGPWWEAEQLGPCIP